MFDMLKSDLEDIEFEPRAIIYELYGLGKLFQSFALSASIKDSSSASSIMKAVRHIFIKRNGVDLPTGSDSLFQLVEAVKYMRFWLWAAEKSIEINGKDAAPELLEFYEADRRDYDRLTNSEKE